MKRKLLVALCCIGFVASCGQKGPLTPPKPQPSQTSTPTTAGETPQKG